jgi:hypothetical protein
MYVGGIKEYGKKRNCSLFIVFGCCCCTGCHRKYGSMNIGVEIKKYSGDDIWVFSKERLLIELI